MSKHVKEPLQKSDVMLNSSQTVSPHLDSSSMRRIFLRDKQVLSYFGDEASPEFWSQVWAATPPVPRAHTPPDHFFTPVMQELLNPGSKILEGGCGNGSVAQSLAAAGFKVVGLDFNCSTLRRLKNVDSELLLSSGDVRALPFKDACFDGYISGGVIEHFWGGYASILLEMQRVLKDGAILCLTFPYMSPLRTVKARMGCYTSSSSEEIDATTMGFYQFALNSSATLSDLERAGFNVLSLQPLDGFKGWIDEVSLLAPLLKSLQKYKQLTFLRKTVDRGLRAAGGHIIRIVLQKRATKVS